MKYQDLFSLKNKTKKKLKKIKKRKIECYLLQDLVGALNAVGFTNGEQNYHIYLNL